MKKYIITATICVVAFLSGHVSLVQNSVQSFLITRDREQEVSRLNAEVEELKKQNAEISAQRVDYERNLRELKNKVAIYRQPESVLSKDDKALKDTLNSTEK